MDNRDRYRDEDLGRQPASPEQKADSDEQSLESPLGLAGEPIARTGADSIRASGDEQSVRRRRRRAGLGYEVEERRSTGLGDILDDDHPGATGIDMGYGGDGTQIKR